MAEFHQQQQRPWKKSRSSNDGGMVVSTGSSPFVRNNKIPPQPPNSTSAIVSSSGSSKIAVLHQQQQIESLQCDLDHERAGRALDHKQSSQQLQRFAQQLEFAVQETADIKLLLTETQQQHDTQIQRLQSERDKANAVSRQLQLQQLSTRTNETDDDDCVEDLRYENTQLQSKITALLDQQETVTDQMEELRASVTEQLEQRDENGTDAVPLIATATPEVLQELNRVRIEVSDRERQLRQRDVTLQASERRIHDLLQEVESYKSKSHRLDTIVEPEYNQLRQSYEQMHASHQAWVELGCKLRQAIMTTPTKSSNSVCPPELSAVLRHIDTLQERVDTTTQRADTYKAETAQLQSQVDTLKESTRVMLQEKQELVVAAATAEQARLSSDHQTQLYKREIDSLQTLIQTFEGQLMQKKKVTPTTPSTPLGVGKAATSPLQSPVAYGILEAKSTATAEQLTECNRVQAETASKLIQCEKEKSECAIELDRVKDKFGKLRTALMAEKEKVSEANARAVTAEQLAGKGSFDPNRTRVLHFTKTPLLQALKDEVTVLKRQLQQHQGSSSRIVTTDPDKVNQRLKESFREQIATFREGVYLATGYKFDMLPSSDSRPTFRLRSMFAEREDDQLLLQWPVASKLKTKSLDLLNTDMAKSFVQDPSYQYMSKYNSLPAFLASIQLQLFENQTIM